MDDGNGYWDVVLASPSNKKARKYSRYSVSPTNIPVSKFREFSCSYTGTHKHDILRVPTRIIRLST